ncbi:hypothetical protein KIN20_021085 [Parelaphostrongylus tenuis]|uniref:Uncharacterized protein n=1 Tax=Parelaphostrongylus tenuis TaxID=148309 RepID=A0AAD5QVY3_PARTN|nr:hypothetical protein KIN20_021085 [Parelaphostrongylus tenuis]
MLERNHLHGRQSRVNETNRRCAEVRTVREDRPSKYPIPLSLHSVMAERLSMKTCLVKNKRSAKSDVADIWLKFEQLYTRK